MWVFSVSGHTLNLLFNSTADGSREPGGDVTVLQPVWQGTASFSSRSGWVSRIVVGRRFLFGVLDHGAESLAPVDFSSNALDKGIGEDVVGIAAALNGSVVER